MIRQDQRTTGRSNSGRQAPTTQRNYSRIPIVSDLLDMFSGGGGQPEMQTTTQQNLPSWAIPDAMSTLAMGNYYTQNPDYRASTLDRDYSGIRGGTSGVGQVGLNPRRQALPALPGANLDGTTPYRPNDINNMISVPDNLNMQSPLNLGRSVGRSNYPEGNSLSQDAIDTINIQQKGAGPNVDMSQNLDSGTSNWADETSDMNVIYPWDEEFYGPGGKGGMYPGGKPNSDDETSDDPSIDPKDIFNAVDLTPFQAYDRQRFAAPSDRTVQGETLLANRVGANPFASAKTAARRAANYQSQFTPAALNLTGPTANTYSNVNQGLSSEQYENVNQGLLAEQYGNANQGLTPAQNYSRDFQQNLTQFQDPYTNQVVNQTIKDLDRARRITNNDISGNAARAGAFGSRETLMRAENNRNFADRTAAAVGQLRSQGFQQAADRAQQEQLQRLGLTASDVQNLRGYQSAGNLQGQNISAQDVRDVRGLRSQGALTAQGLEAQDVRDVRGLRSQGALAAQGLGAQSDRDAMNYANQLQMQGNQLGVEQARLAEQFRQGAGALNLQGAGALGNLAQMQTADERQRIADLLASGGAQDARNQQDLDFIFSEFNRELDYPGRQIDLRNAAISPATGSVVTTTQPRYQASPLAQAGGPALAMYAATGNPYLAAAAAAYGLLS